MLTNLDFLKFGQEFPPKCEGNRLDGYKANRLLYEDEFGKVYSDQFRRVEREASARGHNVSILTALNYFKLLTTKIVDFTFGEPPSITAPDEAQQNIIDAILDEINLIDAAKIAAIDMSRYGDGIIFATQDEAGEFGLKVIPPALWFPIVAEDDVKKIEYHVFAWIRGKVLRVDIHKVDTLGVVERHEYEFLNGKIGREIKVESVETGLDFCPVYRVCNNPTSDRVYGIDDYQSIDSVVAELSVRISQVSRVLDKHAAPSMSGPASALERDDVGGEYHLRAGNYFPRSDSDEPEMKYITWDANMDAAFRQIEILTNQLYTLSEMGASAFGDMSNLNGNVPSGSALRRLMISPLAKARRIAETFTGVLRDLISDIARAKGVEIKPQDISVRWNDGLPNDDEEQARIMQMRTAGKPTISQHTAITRLDGLSIADAAAELDEIRADDAADGLSAPPVEYGADET